MKAHRIGWPLLLLAMRVAAEPPRPLMTFASQSYFLMLVGEYDPARGWIRGALIDQPPAPGTEFTLFDPLGRRGDVKTLDERRGLRYDSRLSWSAPISRWNQGDRPYALGLQGNWPEPVRLAQSVPLDDPDLVVKVSAYLKKRGLTVAQPLLTEAWRVDLDGDGTEETLVCAHNDASAMTDEEAADIYALALIYTAHASEPIVLSRQTSRKTSVRDKEMHERYYGVRDFYRFLALVDMTGDGKLDIAFYTAKEDATQITLYTFDRKSVKKVLTAYKPHYQ